MYLRQNRSEAVQGLSLADLIVARLGEAADAARNEWHTPGRIHSAVIDDLLPAGVTQAVQTAFPACERMMLKRSIRENKHVAAQMDQCDPLVEEAVFAFQDPRVIAQIAAITGLAGLEPDPELYAGGISAMGRGAYLRPHLDNSHDRTRARYRVVNLLFYVTPGWNESMGGSLQLWDEGPRGPARTIASRFNRLVLMATDRHSWHSVNEVTGEGVRRCVSNYYFSRQSPAAEDYFHATSFRAENGQGPADLVMLADNALRTGILAATGNRLFNNPHRYRRVDGDEAAS